MGTSAADWVTAVGTAGAALAAAAAAWKASRSTAASLALVRIERERLEAEREQRAIAELRVEHRLGRDMAWRIELVNQGPAAARDVEMWVHKPGDPNEVYRLLRRSSDMPLRRERLAPQDKLTAEAERGGMRSPGGLDAEVIYAWTDSRGRHEHAATVTA